MLSIRKRQINSGPPLQRLRPMRTVGPYGCSLGLEGSPLSRRRNDSRTWLPVRMASLSVSTTSGSAAAFGPSRTIMPVASMSTSIPCSKQCRVGLWMTLSTFNASFSRRSASETAPCCRRRLAVSFSSDSSSRVGVANAANLPEGKPPAPLARLHHRVREAARGLFQGVPKPLGGSATHTKVLRHLIQSEPSPKTRTERARVRSDARLASKDLRPVMPSYSAPSDPESYTSSSVACSCKGSLVSDGGYMAASIGASANPDLTFNPMQAYKPQARVFLVRRIGRN